MSATSPPEGAMRADARRNRQRLIEAALAAFAEHGADDASLDEIARRAGVGIGTLYRHFPTRQALLEAVYRSQVEALCARADEYSAQVGGRLGHRCAGPLAGGAGRLRRDQAEPDHLDDVVAGRQERRGRQLVQRDGPGGRGPAAGPGPAGGRDPAGRGRVGPAEDVTCDLGRLRVPVVPFRPGSAAAHGDAGRAAPRCWSGRCWSGGAGPDRLARMAPRRAG